MDAAALKEHEEVTKVKNVRTLELGKYQMDTWCVPGSQGRERGRGGAGASSAAASRSCGKRAVVSGC